MKILGIDPGMGIIGFGVIEKGRTPKMIDAGVIRTKIGNPDPSRLKEAYDGMREIIKEFQPDIAAVEKLFFVQNVTTGMSVAQSRGVILLALEEAKIPIYEYAPNEIKMAMTGYGHAKKAQIQEMVRVQLKLKKKPSPDDAADALAVALTHSAANLTRLG